MQNYTNPLDKEGRIAYYNTIFNFNRNETVHKRRYIKLPEVISRVTGSLSSIIVCFTFLVVLYNGFLRDSLLINSLFDVSQTKPHSVVVQVDSLVDSSKVEDSKVEAKPPKEDINLSFFAFYLRVCRRSADFARNSAFFVTARSYIAEKMDVRTILELQDKFTKLCDYTLTEEQKEEIQRNKTRLAMIN